MYLVIIVSKPLAGNGSVYSLEFTRCLKFLISRISVVFAPLTRCPSVGGLATRYSFINNNNISSVCLWYAHFACVAAKCYWNVWLWPWMCVCVRVCVCNVHEPSLRWCSIDDERFFFHVVVVIFFCLCFFFYSVKRFGSNIQLIKAYIRSSFSPLCAYEYKTSFITSNWNCIDCNQIRRYTQPENREREQQKIRSKEREREGARKLRKRVASISSV